MRVVAVLGVPGAGKSTQARVLAAELGGVARSAGDWVRERAAGGDPVARETVHTGQAIPPALYRAFVTEALAGPGPLVLDGSPRDEHHVAVLAAALPPDATVTGILLDLPAAQATTRIAARRSPHPAPTDPTAAGPTARPAAGAEAGAGAGAGGAAAGWVDDAGPAPRRPDDAGPVVAVRIAGQVAGLPGLVAAFEAHWPLTVVDATAPPATVTGAVRRAVAGPRPGCPPAGGPPS